MGIQVQSLWRGYGRRFCVCVEDHSAHDRVLIDARFQHWEEWLFAMFEAQRLVVRIRIVDGSNDNPPLVADILPRYTPTFAGALTVLAKCIKYTERFCLTR